MLTFGTFLVFLGGVLFLAGIFFVMLPHAKKDKAWLTTINWLLYLAAYLDFAIGISFIYINMQVGHAKATSTAIFVFIGSALILTLIWLRTMGLLGNKKNTKQQKEAA